MAERDDDGITLRRFRPEDVDACARICFEAFCGINQVHGFPPDFPSVDVARGLFSMMAPLPNVYGVVAEQDGRVVGSNFLWEWLPVSGIGPITVSPEVQARSVGRRLMEDVLARARLSGAPGVRLVQAAFNTRSFSLYSKLGFDVREPLSCIQGTVRRVDFPGYAVRPATPNDAGPCADLCRRAHGHERRDEFAAAVAQGTARVVEHGGQVTGYATDLGFFGHAVARGNAELLALIGAAERISGPGMLLPSRNGVVLRWCLAHGLRVVQPMTLMSLGLYNEPRGAFIPSILF